MIDINKVQEPESLKEVAKFIASNNAIITKINSYKKNNAFGDSDSPSDALVIPTANTDKSIILAVNNRTGIATEDSETNRIGIFESIRDIACSGGTLNGSAYINCTGNIADSSDYQKFTESFHSASNNNSQNSILGVVGTLENNKYKMTLDFKSKGHDLFLIGTAVEDINSSIYLNQYHKINESAPQYYSIEEEFEVQKVIRDIIRKGFIASAHNVSKGGLFISLMESAMHRGLGFDVLTDSDIRPDAYLFGESQGRVLVSVDPIFETEFIDYIKFQNVQCTMLGHVTKGEFRIDDESFGFVADYKQIYL
ncbi:MAG: AIR synthase-related protein [Bacteroidota bacterium]